MDGLDFDERVNGKACGSRVNVMQVFALDALSTDGPSSQLIERYLTVEEAAGVILVELVHIAQYTNSVVGPESTMQAHGTALALCCLT